MLNQVQVEKVDAMASISYHCTYMCVCVCVCGGHKQSQIGCSLINIVLLLCTVSGVLASADAKNALEKKLVCDLVHTVVMHKSWLIKVMSQYQEYFLGIKAASAQG